MIKPIVSVGYAAQIKEKVDCESIQFWPEFLREEKALYDNFHLSWIIIGKRPIWTETSADLIVLVGIKESIEMLFTDSTEAETI